MTDTQVLTVVIAVIAAPGSLLYNYLYNNARIADVGKRLDDLTNSFNKRIDDVNRHIDDKFDLLMDRLQRMDDNIARQLADLNSRIEKLEHPR